MRKIKNIAIVAHVDHGKTTLVDAILRQAGVFNSHQKVEERVMDSNDLEKERGITIFSKNASFYYKDYKVNIVDTPGHADFGGEVQRILKMVDSVLLVVDAYEGTMPQTKYVLKKSLELGLKPIVVINKIDRPNARPQEVLDMVFDLFVELNASDEQLDFPVVFASAREGVSKYHMNEEAKDLIPLFDTIIKNVKDTEGDETMPFQLLVSAISYDNYLGKMGTGKIVNGKVSQGDNVVLMKRNGEKIIYRVTKIFTFEGLAKAETKEALAGDIVTLAGLEKIDVGETVACVDNPVALPTIDIDRPTMSMTFKVNDSPFAGMEGKFVTSRNIKERLDKELQTNVSIIVEPTDSPDSFVIKGRGELQLAILIENMRREGFELQVSKPQVIYREVKGEKFEPIEYAIVDVPSEFVGIVIEQMGKRKGEMVNMVPGADSYTRLEFKVPTRGLLGFRNEFMTETRGTGIINHSFLEYGPYRGEVPTRTRGVLIVMEEGKAVAYAMDKLQDRGKFFVAPGADVYPGMIVGENSRENDMIINICKEKKLSNMRTTATDDAIKLEPPRQFSLEQGMEYIGEDELLEITPKNIRMRKKILNASQRKRADIAIENLNEKVK
jgi:GTP-binding protein